MNLRGLVSLYTPIDVVGVNLRFLLVADGEFAAHRLPLETRQITENPIRCACGGLMRVEMGEQQEVKAAGQSDRGGKWQKKKSRLFLIPVTEEISTLARRCSNEERAAEQVLHH